MPTESWAIHMHKEYFKFSCAHFLIFPDGSKERLHGHNYHVDAEIEGQLTDKGIVIDFILVKPVIRELCDTLDEHWILPGQHPELKIDPRDDGHTEVVYRNCRYLVPTEETIVLPINNTSAENLSTWLGRELDGSSRGTSSRRRAAPDRSEASRRTSAQAATGHRFTVCPTSSRRSSWPRSPTQSSCRSGGATRPCRSDPRFAM
ncbi:MAG: 6-carboxytetrahydropterin synthase [Myxococcota bacterium]